MAASGVLRTARQILKFMADGHGFERVMKNVRKSIQWRIRWGRSNQLRMMYT